MLHPAQIPIEQLLKDCRVERTRRSGPGGQHRNKVETAIVIEHLPTGIRGEASERRSQQQNRRMAIQRLRVKLALTIRQSPAQTPSEVWKQRVADGRMVVNPQHEDFPAILAEALDVLHANRYQIPRAAEQLGLTSSQLVKLLKIDRSGLQLVNHERSALGLTPLQ